MRRLIIIIFLLPLFALGQISDDSLKSYTNTYIIQNASQSITGQQMNNLLIDIIESKLNIDSAFTVTSTVGDTLFVTYVNNATGSVTTDTIIKTGGGGAADNLGDHRMDQTLETKGYWIGRDGDDEGAFFEADGDVKFTNQVGIGNQTPSFNLDVSGDAKIRVDDETYPLWLQGVESRDVYVRYSSQNDQWCLGMDDNLNFLLLWDCTDTVGYFTSAGNLVITGFIQSDSSIKIGNSSTVTSPTSGELKFDGSTFRGYDGSNWVELGGAGGGANYASVLEYGADADGVANDSVEIETALASESAIFFPSGDYNIGGGITIPANKQLVFENGAKLTTTESSATITGNSTSILSGACQIFDTLITFTGSWVIDQVYPEFFGAATGDAVNDVAEINKAADLARLSTGKMLRLSAGTYRCEDIQLDFSDLKVIGNGSESTVIEADLDSDIVFIIAQGSATDTTGLDRNAYKGEYYVKVTDATFTSTLSVGDLVMIESDKETIAIARKFASELYRYIIDAINFKFDYESVWGRTKKYQGFSFQIININRREYKNYKLYIVLGIEGSLGSGIGGGFGRVYNNQSIDGVLVLPILKEPYTLGSSDELNRRYKHSVVVHEFIHYLDSLKYKGAYKSKSAQYARQGDNTKYFSSPAEFNAFYLESLEAYERGFSAIGEVERDDILSSFKNFYLDFWDTQRIKFSDNLDKKYKRKFYKRLYDLYSKLKENYS